MQPAERTDGERPVEEVDASGDAVFRFSIATDGEGGESRTRGPRALDDFYCEQLRDILQVVRLYAGERHVIVDGFAFADHPNRILPLVRRNSHDE